MSNKTLATLGLTLLMLTPSNAETVTSSRAEAAAINFLASKGIVQKTLTIVPDGKIRQTTKASIFGDIPFYVFTFSDRGFVIMSGDDKFEPVLGYSTDSPFNADDLPDALKTMLKGYENAISVIRSVDKAQCTEALTEWQSLETPTKSGTVQSKGIYLQTACWNQRAPYNNLCPEYNESMTLTGCAATALAEVMRYHRWPDCGYGTVPAYTTRTLGLTVAERTLGHSYDWDNMPLQYPQSGGTDAQNNAVATLMADLGHIMNANYTTTGTGAYNSYVPNVLKYMKYSKKARLESRSGYSTGEWVQILENELNEGNPILYLGQNRSSGSGHMYVLDGYDADDRFHFNWGWSGSGNGYFYIADTEFSEDEDAFIGFTPDKTWTGPESYSHLILYGNRIWTDQPYVNEGEETTLRLTVLNDASPVNMEGKDYSGKLQFRLRGDDGTETELGTTTFNLASNYYTTISTDITLNTISEGDEIVVYYLDGSEWIPLNNGTAVLKLRYKLRKEISVEYFIYNQSKYLTFTGRVGMTLRRADGSSTTFGNSDLTIAAPGAGTTETFEISDGNTTVPITLTF